MKDIKIQVNGTSNNYSNTKKINTQIVPYGNANWVPVDEVTTASLTVTKNGTYVAEDAGYYGYSYVDVDVPTGQEVTGTDPETGIVYTVTVDGDGNIVKTPV